MSPNPKQLAGEQATAYVEDGMVVGLGTGSTAYFAIRKLGERLRQGLRFRGLPTSERSRALAVEEGIPLLGFSEISQVDLTIDGADEVDPAFNLIKGGGGALLREKIVASITGTEIIVVDEAKPVDHLGTFPLPVEIVPFGWQATQRRLKDLDCRPRIRQQGDVPFETDNGNWILDCGFGRIEDPPDLEARIVAICGVVECGLFTGLVHRLIIGKADGSLEDLAQPRPR